MKKMGGAKGLKIEGGLRTHGRFHKKSEPGKPLISIITVVLNCEKYLKQTIHSVINQTYDNIEYIIVDGDSTDGSLDIVRKYDNQIAYWICERDSGIYDAMNKGLSFASGDFINFLNAGDTYYSENTLLNISKYISYDIVYGNTLYVTSSEKYKFTACKNLNYRNLKKGMKVNHQSIFYRKDVFNDFGSFDINYIFVADYEHLIRIAERNIKFYYTNLIHDLYIEEGFNSNYWLKSNIEVFKIQQKYYGNILALFVFIKTIIRKIFSLILPHKIKLKIKILIFGN